METEELKEEAEKEVSKLGGIYACTDISETWLLVEKYIDKALLSGQAHQRKIDAERLRKWAHSGTHRGVGTPECPKHEHHHHDEKCEIAEMLAAAIEKGDL